MNREDLPSSIKESLRYYPRDHNEGLNLSDTSHARAMSSNTSPDDILWVYQLLNLDNIQKNVLGWSIGEVEPKGSNNTVLSIIASCPGPNFTGKGTAHAVLEIDKRSGIIQFRCLSTNACVRIVEDGEWIRLAEGESRALHGDIFFRIDDRQYKAIVNPCNIDYTAYVERRNALIVESGGSIPNSRILGIPRGKGSLIKIGDCVIHATIKDPSLGISHIGVNIKTGEVHLIQEKWVDGEWERNVALKAARTSMRLGVSVTSICGNWSTVPTNLREQESEGVSPPLEARCLHDYSWDPRTMFANSSHGLHSCRERIENIYLFYHLPARKLIDIDCKEVHQNTLWLWIRNLMVGLDKIHSRGVAHQNIRKETVIISPDPSPGAALIDFSQCSDSRHMETHRPCGAVKDITDLGMVIAPMVDPQLNPVQGSRSREGWLTELERRSARSNGQMMIAAAAIHDLLGRPEDPNVLQEVLHFYGEYDAKKKAWRHAWKKTESPYVSSDEDHDGSSDEEYDDFSDEQYNDSYEDCVLG